MVIDQLKTLIAEDITFLQSELKVEYDKLTKREIRVEIATYKKVLNYIKSLESKNERR